MPRGDLKDLINIFHKVMIINLIYLMLLPISTQTFLNRDILHIKKIQGALMKEKWTRPPLPFPITSILYCYWDHDTAH